MSFLATAACRTATARLPTGQRAGQTGRSDPWSDLGLTLDPWSVLDGAAHVPRDLLQRGKPLLERRVIHEELGRCALHRSRDDEEGIHRLYLAQVALRDP